MGGKDGSTPQGKPENDGLIVTTEGFSDASFSSVQNPKQEAIIFASVKDRRRRTWTIPQMLSAIGHIDASSYPILSKAPDADLDLLVPRIQEREANQVGSPLQLVQRCAFSENYGA